MKEQIGSNLMKEEYLSIDTITRLAKLEKENKELHDRLDRIIKEINDYEEDYYEEPSAIVNKRDRKDIWSFEEYQETIYRIATGEDNEN